MGFAFWFLLLALYPLPGPQREAATHQSLFQKGNHSGLERFRLLSGDERKRYIIEANSAGVCAFDYDNDGRVDVYLVNGGDLESFKKSTPSKLRNALFRNLGKRRFAEVTKLAGVGGRGQWGMGCSVADYDNDGWLDLYVTNYGDNLLYRNRGDGTFEEVAGPAGANDARWSTGSAWADFDVDGDLDLFVANYIGLDPANLPEPGSPRYGSMGGPGLGCQYLGLPVMCGPRGLKGAGDSLFVNQGNGTFEEAAARVGVQDGSGHYGLGAIWSDLDGNGLPDLYVANDSTPNYLYRNLGNGRLEEIGLLSGLSVSSQGLEQAGMGVAAADYLNQGRFSLYVTNFSEEYNTLYRNDGDFNFTDITVRSGLDRPSLPYVGWGALFLDYDNDGWEDLFVANGHVFPNVDQVKNPFVAPYRQRNLLFRNLGNGRFQEVGEDAGLGSPLVSRGAACADFDNDGGLDVIVNNLGSTPTLLWNQRLAIGHFLRLQLIGTVSNRFAVGAGVRLRTGTQWQSREVRSGGSYLSQSDLRVHFGLGRADRAAEVEIRWPSGKVTALKDVAADQTLTVRER
ncbi:MAG: CRTAC1 family protein [Acidobacteriota bacterium]